ncbi:MAG TPA: IS200/IS605 family transposase [Ignavibacteria bacterium]|nr:IS200/IS605 family transposase [Ignavibacteria bacterium]
MSWIRIWIHLVFSTKNREPYFTSKEKREKIIEHIKSNAKKKDIWLEEINGHKEHIHCLISLGKEQSISKVSQLIKGESSKWINEEKLTKTKFFWQDDYWAVSVSESHLEQVKEYIRNQEEHHRTKSFTEEVDDFMKKYGWKFIQ